MTNGRPYDLQNGQCLPFSFADDKRSPIQFAEWSMFALTVCGRPMVAHTICRMVDVYTYQWSSVLWQNIRNSPNFFGKTFFNFITHVNITQNPQIDNSICGLNNIIVRGLLKTPSFRLFDYKNHLCSPYTVSGRPMGAPTFYNTDCPYHIIEELF